MAIKAKFIECECGALFQENDSKITKGDFTQANWEGSATQDERGFTIKFKKKLSCEACKVEFAIQEKTYEISFPTNNDESKIEKSSLIHYFY